MRSRTRVGENTKETEKLARVLLWQNVASPPRTKRQSVRDSSIDADRAGEDNRV